MFIFPPTFKATSHSSPLNKLQPNYVSIILRLHGCVFFEGACLLWFQKETASSEVPYKKTHPYLSSLPLSTGLRLVEIIQDPCFFFFLREDVCRMAVCGFLRDRGSAVLVRRPWQLDSSLALQRLESKRRLLEPHRIFRPRKTGLSSLSPTWELLGCVNRVGSLASCCFFCLGGPD